MLDIIIPVLNEEKILSERRDYFQLLGQKANLTFVDGSSNDKTRERAQSLGKVIQSNPGRSLQKNLGAQEAQSENLLFLHVDTVIALQDIDLIEVALNSGAACGCLTMKIEDKARIFRLFERIVNSRAKRFGVMDGDLGMFIKRKVFNELGQFGRVPIMEDIMFSKKLKRKFSPQVLPATINVSSRKWHEKGFATVFFLYTLAYLQMWTTIPFFRFKLSLTQSQERVNHER